MRKKRMCINGCSFPPEKSYLIENKDKTFSYGRDSFNCCPYCGALLPEAIEKIRSFFEVYQLHPSLAAAERLIYKAELDSAARESFIAVENRLRQLSGLDLHGMDLATKALSFAFDQKTETITCKPLIAVSDLVTESKRNEQNGLRFLLMGFFAGQRNIYQHNNSTSGLSGALTVVIEASFIMHRLDGHSLLEGGEWIKTSITDEEILQRMPKTKDRIRFMIEHKRRLKDYSNKQKHISDA